MKNFLILFCSLILSGQLLAGAGPMDEETAAKLDQAIKDDMYKTDNTLESFAGAISSRVGSEFGSTWGHVNATTDRIKGYKDDELNIRGLGKAYVHFDGANCCVENVTVKFNRGQVSDDKIIKSFASQFDPASEITSIKTCSDNQDSSISQDVFKLVLPGREPISFKIRTDDEFVKFTFSPSEDSPCDEEQEIIPAPASPGYIKGDL